MRKISFEEKRATIRVEYDISKLTRADIAALVHAAGIDDWVLTGELRNDPAVQAGSSVQFKRDPASEGARQTKTRLKSPRW